MKRLTAILLALLTFVLPAFAGGEESVPGPDEFVPEIMGEYFRSDENYAIAFRSMYDGETWLWNSDEYFKVASVYKLPLNMYFYELEAAGAIICALAFFSGVNLFGTGLVGQYVGKTYMESKHRPRYFIEEIVE